MEIVLVNLVSVKKLSPCLNLTVCYVSVECQTTVKQLKIINGMDSAPGHYPSVVSVALDEGVHICGGSILTTSLVVTSAHCLKGVEDNVWRLRVRSGTVDLSAGVISNVTSIAIHEQYDPFSFWTNDIALINVATQFILDSNTTAAAVLPEPEEELPEGTNVTAIGWGLIYEDDVFPQILQNVQLKISSQDSCNEIYSALGAQINQTMMCAGVQDKRGICSGDAGGPLIADGVTIALTSWSVNCADPKYPAVFTRISSFIDWISKHSANNS
uniref:Peptidase S1 domain-containing protein n=1 Tax=Timema genevievae TaxID=629358 RepID=A0A7R9PQA1_TIMGE|nr:unnamed protein product [Timema genevievae]